MSPEFQILIPIHYNTELQYVPICVQCSLACHKKCLETLAIQCGHKKLQGRLHLFGIDFTQAAKNSHDDVPFIIRKCTSEIENRALNMKVFSVKHESYCCRINSDCSLAFNIYEHGNVELLVSFLIFFPVCYVTSVSKKDFAALDASPSLKKILPST